MEKKGNFPATIKWVKMPGYWKRDGRYILKILFGCDSYHVHEGQVDLPRSLSIAFKAGARGLGKTSWLILFLFVTVVVPNVVAFGRYSRTPFG
jgi:hypothetical protein